MNPAFLFAALLWEPLREQMRRLQANGLDDHDALHEAAEIVTHEQSRRVALPRRYSLPMREIWELQSRLAQITGKRPLRLATHPRLRAAYDFLILRADTDEQAAELADWWTRFLGMNEAERIQATQPTTRAQAKKGKPRRRRKPRSVRQDQSAPPPGSDV